MKPQLLEKSHDEPLFNIMVSCISDIDCSSFFSDHIGLSQPEQREIVNRFQSHVRSVLAESLPDIDWLVEHCPSHDCRDSIDIFGQGDNFTVAIELDKHRADQVAKKFVSRMAVLPDAKIYFVSLCYPGTDKMNPAECTKYFGYCSNLSTRMGNRYAGFIIS
jgi:hypothetical protein